MKTCSQTECNERADVSYVWPGRAERSYACCTHFVKTEAIARAMGFDLGDVQRAIDVGEFEDSE